MKISNKGQMIIIVVLFLILWIVIPAMFIERSNKKKDIFGKNLVIKGDTLMVMGFDQDTQNYILDDGRQVAERMIELFKIETDVD